MARRVSQKQTVMGALSSDPVGSTDAKTPYISEQTRQHPSFLYSMLNPRSRQWPAVLFKTVISVVILIDLVSFILATEKGLHTYHKHLQGVELVSSTVFLLEYVARVVTCMEKPRYHHYGPVWGRLRFMLSGALILDALAALPYFVEPLVGFELPRLTYLRFLRLTRITKTNGAMKATDAVYRVIYYNKEILYVAAFVSILLVLGTGVMLYYLRPVDTHTHDFADEQFQSILSTMYLATLMLTGQGSPEGELPWYTKMVVLMTSIVSVAMFAIPASMLTWGFEAEAQRMAKRAYTIRQRKESGLGDDELFDDDYSTDEEYQKIIAGEDDDDEDATSAEVESSIRKELLKKFQNADADGSGNLTLREFVQLSSGHTEGKAGEGPVLTGMMCRVQQLERDVKSNSEKLDRILELLDLKKSK